MSTNYPDISSYTTTELLSLTLRESCNSPLIAELTNRFSTLQELTSATITELTEIKGLGPVKASILLAAIELAKRLNKPPADEPKIILGPQDVANLVMFEMRFLDREHFRAIMLNTKNHVIKIETVAIGTLNSTAIHPRELFKSAIKSSAASIILVHNHPSGNPTPSEQDIEITQRLVEVGKLIGIEVLDHVIIGSFAFTSFKEKGLV